MLSRSYSFALFVPFLVILVLLPVAIAQELSDWNSNSQNSDVSYTQTTAEVGGPGLQFTVISRNDANEELPWVTVAVVVPLEFSFSTLQPSETFVVGNERILKISLGDVSRAVFNVYSSVEKVGDVKVYIGWDFPPENLWTDPNFQQSLPGMLVDSISVSFTTANLPPQVSTANIAANTGTVTSTSLLNFVQDENPPSLSFNLYNCASFISLSGQELVVDTTALSLSSTYSCSYSANDGVNPIVYGSLILTITHLNQAPQFAVERLSIPERRTTMIDFTPYITDENIATVRFTNMVCGGGDTSIIIDGIDGVKVNLTAGDTGSSECTGTATDDAGESTSDTFIIDVDNVNDEPQPTTPSPTFELTPETENLLLTVPIYLLATDPDGDVLTFVLGSAVPVTTSGVQLVQETATALTFSPTTPLLQY